jgi:hypothetical protein
LFVKKPGGRDLYQTLEENKGEKQRANFFHFRQMFDKTTLDIFGQNIFAKVPFAGKTFPERYCRWDLWFFTQQLSCFVGKCSVADPGSGAFLTPGSGKGENQDPDPGSYFLELRNNFLG